MNRSRSAFGVVALPLVFALLLPCLLEAGPQLQFSDGFESATSGQIAAARAAPDGAVSLPIDGATVTYVKPQIGNDVAGFFVQAEMLGPALFIAVDPASLAPPPDPGDLVSFTIIEMETSFALRQAVAITAYLVGATGQPLAGLVQDVSLVNDLVTSVDTYESELIELAGTITGAFGAAGAGFESADIETDGILGDPNLELRLPTALRDSEDLMTGCNFELGPTPMWRINAVAQTSAWADADVAALLCPDPRVLGAGAEDSTTVQVEFDRFIDPGSVQPDASQFVFDNGLTALAVAVNGREITVTTMKQVPDLIYTVTVASSVLDTLGAGIDAAFNQASFSGFSQPAGLLINELNANIDSGCDLVELLVLSGGSMSGFELFERTGSVLTFGALAVEVGDVVVVHFDGGDPACNPGPSGNETASVDEFSNATYPQNYDTAWDWYSSDSGITSTDNVLTLYDAQGNILDAVFASDAPDGLAAAATETQAAVVAAAGEWEMVGGGVPPGGFIDDDFNAHAVQDLDGTGTSSEGNSIQRNQDADSNTKADWTVVPPSWGLSNAGQSP